MQTLASAVGQCLEVHRWASGVAPHQPMLISDSLARSLPGHRPWVFGAADLRITSISVSLGRNLPQENLPPFGAAHIFHRSSGIRRFPPILSYPQAILIIRAVKRSRLRSNGKPRGRPRPAGSWLVFPPDQHRLHQKLRLPRSRFHSWLWRRDRSIALMQRLSSLCLDCNEIHPSFLQEIDRRRYRHWIESPFRFSRPR